VPRMPVPGPPGRSAPKAGIRATGTPGRCPATASRPGPGGRPDSPTPRRAARHPPTPPAAPARRPPRPPPPPAAPARPAAPPPPPGYPAGGPGGPTPPPLPPTLGGGEPAHPGRRLSNSVLVVVLAAGVLGGGVGALADRALAGQRTVVSALATPPVSA